MKSNSRTIRVVRTNEQEEAADLRKTTTPLERMEITWQLSQTAWLFKGEEDVTSELRRHAVRVLRGRS